MIKNFTKTVSDSCTGGEFLTNYKCVKCPLNTYSEAGATKCTDCPDGQVTANTGSKSVSDCETCEFIYLY